MDPAYYLNWQLVTSCILSIIFYNFIDLLNNFKFDFSSSDMSRLLKISGRGSSSASGEHIWSIRASSSSSGGVFFRIRLKREEKSFRGLSLFSRYLSCLRSLNSLEFSEPVSTAVAALVELKW